MRVTLTERISTVFPSLSEWQRIQCIPKLSSISLHIPMATGSLRPVTQQVFPPYLNVNGFNASLNSIAVILQSAYQQIQVIIVHRSVTMHTVKDHDRLKQVGSSFSRLCPLVYFKGMDLSVK
jgi:hypothetical protein